jgi:uncharacterized spore protein YtfJ
VAERKELIGMTQTNRNGAPVLETVRGVIDNVTAERVFGHPITHDGVTVVPVARVSGGGGGGSGSGPDEEGHEASGTGGGVGLSAKPLGVFVVRDGRVSWRPALDLNKVIIGGQIVMVAALLVLRALINSRARTQG